MPANPPAAYSRVRWNRDRRESRFYPGHRPGDQESDDYPPPRGKEEVPPAQVDPQGGAYRDQVDFAYLIRLSDNDLRATDYSGKKTTVSATEGRTTGRWFWEISIEKIPDVGGWPERNDLAIGVGFIGAGYLDRTNESGTCPGEKPGSVSYSTGGSLLVQGVGRLVEPATTNNKVASTNDNDVIGVALDADNRTVAFFRNGQPLKDLTASPVGLITINHPGAGSGLGPELFPLIGGLGANAFTASANFVAPSKAPGPHIGYPPPGYRWYDQTQSMKTFIVRDVNFTFRDSGGHLVLYNVPSPNNPKIDTANCDIFDGTNWLFGGMLPASRDDSRNVVKQPHLPFIVYGGGATRAFAGAHVPIECPEICAFWFDSITIESGTVVEVIGEINGEGPVQRALALFSSGDLVVNGTINLAGGSAYWDGIQRQPGRGGSGGWIGSHGPGQRFDAVVPPGGGAGGDSSLASIGAAAEAGELNGMAATPPVSQDPPARVEWPFEPARPRPLQQPTYPRPTASLPAPGGVVQWDQGEEGNGYPFPRFLIGGSGGGRSNPTVGTPGLPGGGGGAILLCSIDGDVKINPGALIDAKGGSGVDMYTGQVDAGGGGGAGGSVFLYPQDASSPMGGTIDVGPGVGGSSVSGKEDGGRGGSGVVVDLPIGELTVV